MKKLSIVAVIISGIVFIGCSDVERDPGATYMPDMGYSRAYETYDDHSQLANEDINYTGMPVPGTISRNEELPFPLEKDKTGDSTNYVASKQIVNPLGPLDAASMKEAERLYLINCAICHGTKLDGNGPLYNGGNGPYPAAPKNLVTLNMPEGQMFYSATYGKNLMGSYAAQLSRKQRWMVIAYIKSKQTGGTPSASPAGADSTAAPAKDTAATAKK